MKFLLCIMFLLSSMIGLTQADTTMKRIESLQFKEGVLVALKLTDKDIGQSQLLLRYSDKAYQQGTKNNDLTLILDALVLKSKVYRTKKNFSSSIKEATKALELLNRNEIRYERKELIHQNLSLSLEGLGAYSPALEQRKNQLQALIESNRTNDVQANYYYLKQGIGVLYMRLEQFDSAMVYFQAAQENAVALKRKDLVASSNNDIGVSSFRAGKKRMAIEYYQKSIKTFESMSVMQQKDSLLYGIVWGNIADCLPQNDPAKKKYIDFYVEMCEKYAIVQSDLVEAYFQMAEYFEKNGNYSQQLDYLNRINALLTKSDNDSRESQLMLYKSYTKAYLLSGDKVKASKYLDMYEQLNNELFGKQAVDELLSSHTDYKLAKINQELLLEKLEASQKTQKIEDLNKEKEITSLRIWLVGIGVVFLLILAAVFFYKYKSDSEKKAKSQELENKLLEIENNQQSERLTHSMLSLQRKKDFTEEIIERLSALPSIDRKDLNDIKFFITNEVNIDESIIEMENYISETGKEFFIKLDLVHPGLTDYEQKLIALIRMNLSIKQIAIIKNITPQSVKIAKNRLSKKLELEPGSNIYDYLMSL